MAALQEAGERGRELTLQLLGFARRQVIAPTRLDLREQAVRSEKLLRRVLGEDIVLSVKSEPELWPVSCDAGQLDQVFLNLAANARDAMPRGGRLDIVLQNVRSTPGSDQGPPARNWVSLTLRDTGQGMTREVKSHLFEPFFTTKPRGRGTGLGLPTVYGIVSQNGGQVRVQSEPGQGTSIELLFPAAGEARAEAAPPEKPRPAPEGAAAAPAHTAPPGSAAEPDPGQGERQTNLVVLVVEDDPLVRKVTVRALSDAGYAVLVAEDGREALQALGKLDGALDILITDVVMPGMSGKEVADRAREIRPRLPVLYVSGYPEEVIARRGVLDEGVAFLAKPFKPPELVDRVRAMLAPARA